MLVASPHRLVASPHRRVAIPYPLVLNRLFTPYVVFGAGAILFR